MIVKVDKNFEKDTNKIKNSLLLNKIANCSESKNYPSNSENKKIKRI